MNGADADVVIVGSGPAGVSAARPLVEAGFFVTLVDAAESELPNAPQRDIESFRKDGEGWRHAFGDDLAGLGFGGARSPKFATRRGLATLASDQAPPSIDATGFVPVRSSSTGGLSSIWGAFVSVYDDIDLRDYPISAADLAPSYRRIAARVGLSGAEHDDLSEFLGAGLSVQRATWISPIAQQLLDRYNKVRPDRSFRLGIARNAVATEPMPGREPCNRCGLCLYGCARGAVYSAVTDLNDLRSHSNFKYLDRSRVTRLIENAETGPAVEVDAIRGYALQRGRALMLAAGTLNSTALLLSLGKVVSKPTRLVTNPVAGLAFIVPRQLKQQSPSKGFSLGQLAYRISLNDAGDYGTGVIYTADMLPASFIAQRLPLSRPTALRVAGALAPALLLATIYLPGRFSRNELSLEPSAQQQQRLVIRGENSQEVLQMLHGAMKGLVRAMRALGAYALPGSFSVTLPGTDAHLAGTIPMTTRGKDLTCTPNCEVRPWKDIFLVDGACLSDLPAKHPTLTIMANADRVAHVVRERLGRPVRPPDWR
jgi:choline dehydrogenase-like flavoprotein